MPKEATKYFVVAAPGYYGSQTLVVSSHHTLASAHKRRGAFTCVREGAQVKGEVFFQSAERHYPRVNADGSRHGGE